MHQRCLRLFPLLVCLGACAPAVAGTSVNGRDPASVATALLEADRTWDFRTAVRWGHPDALRLDAVQLVGSLRSRTDSSFIVAAWPEAASDPVAYQSHLIEQRTSVRRLLDSVYRVPTVDSAAALPPDTLLLRCNQHTPPLDVSWAQQRPKPLLLAVAIRSDTLAYVFYEDPYPVTLGANPPAPVHMTGTITLRRVGDEWRGLFQQCLRLLPLATCNRW